jgi:hypothetical protein
MHSVPRVFAAFVIACCTGTSAQAASWEQAARVAYLDTTLDTTLGTGAPLAQHEVSAALDYAIAAWSARIDVQLQRTETAAIPGYNKSFIVVRWVDTVEMLQAGGDIFSAATTKRWLYKTSGHIAGAEILLRRDNKRLQDTACLRHVLAHELGHALGLVHLSAESSLMHADLTSCHHTLTADDIAAAPYSRHICHAELLPNFDIYIPVVKVGAQYWSARLTYREGYWTVTESHPIASQPGCGDSHLDADTLVLDKVWTQEYMWRAELEKVDGHWRVKYAR